MVQLLIMDQYGFEKRSASTICTSTKSQFLMIINAKHHAHLGNGLICINICRYIEKYELKLTTIEVELSRFHCTRLRN